jgi:tetratricopeptide (TPR) repeat protein
MPADAQVKRIQQAYDSGSLALTVVLARQLLNSDPANPAVLVHLGMALADLGNHPEARAAFERYSELTGGPSPAVLRQFGRLLDAEGRHADAEEWFAKAIQAAPADAQSHIFLGGMLARLGQLERAAECHRRATTCRDGPIDEAWLNLGLVLRALGQYANARDAFDQALALNPDYAEARRARVDVTQAIAAESEQPGT